jgi:hypothetical protein
MTRATWTHSHGNKLRQLAQGMTGQVTETDTIFFIPKDKVPQARAKDVTYGLNICLIRPENTNEPNRTRLVAGGGRVHYPFNAGTPTADLLTIKLFIISVISTPGARFFTMDIKNFYLCTPMTRYEYMQLKLFDMLDNIITLPPAQHCNTRQVHLLQNPPMHVWAPASGDHCAGTIGKKTEGTRLHPEQNNAWAVDT